LEAENLITDDKVHQTKEQASTALSVVEHSDLATFWKHGLSNPKLNLPMSIIRITHKIRFEFCLCEVDDHILMASYFTQSSGKECDSVNQSDDAIVTKLTYGILGSHDCVEIARARGRQKFGCRQHWRPHSKLDPRRQHWLQKHELANQCGRHLHLLMSLNPQNP
jgi:hypothetical protein